MNTVLVEPETEISANAISPNANTGLLAKPPIASDEPEWLQERRASAWQEFQSTPFPHRNDQTWRFSSLEVTKIDGFQPAQEINPELSAELIGQSGGLREPSLVFVNDRPVSTQALPEHLVAKGVLLLPLAEALKTHEALIRDHFMTQKADLGSVKYAALHEAGVSNGTFLYVPKNVEVDIPLEVCHWHSGDATALFPHTLLIAEANSKVTLIDSFRSASKEDAGFACGINDLYAADGAKVTYVLVQDWNRKMHAFHMNATVVGRDAAVTNLTLNFGGSRIRGESTSRLNAEGGRSDMLSVNIVSGDQEIDQRTLQDHLKPHTTSDLLYKNALLDEADTIFSGLIRVEKGAHYTDAYQKVRNLLLSDDAEANSMPGLEINADEVRCSHGATSGQLDESELFYLLARGIPVDKARQLITVGFLNEVFERLPRSEVTDYLSALVEKRFTENAFTTAA